MMKIRTLVAAAVLTSTLFAGNAAYAQDAQVCQPGIAAGWQQYPCGFGLETKLSTTDGTNESYIAFRAGAHLDSLGTIRMSTKN